MKSVVNKKHLFDIVQQVYSNRKITRAQIAKRINLNKATVTSNVQFLLECNVIKEVESEVSKAGRPGQLLMLNEDYANIIVVEIDKKSITFFLCKLDGEVIEKIVDTIADGIVRDEDFFNKLDYLCGILRKGEVRLAAICVATPGLVNLDGVVEFTPYIKIANNRIKQTIQSRYDCNVLIENESNLKAIGNALSYNEISNIISISIGTGVGAGCIIHGQLYHGNKGFAGEIGHICVELNGVSCPCGNKGCLEQYTSNFALSRYANEKFGFNGTFDELVECISDYPAVIQQFIDYFSMALHNVNSLFNPEVILLDGKLVEIDAVQKGLLENLQSVIDNSKIIFGFSDVQDSLINGCINLIFENYYYDVLNNRI